MSPDTAILQLTQAKGLGAGTLNRVLKRLSKEGRAPEDLVEASVDELVRDYGLRGEVAQAVKTIRSEAEKLSEELARQDVRVLFKGAVDYPAHLIQVLGDTAPPVLFARGNLEILQRQAVGFTGSRKTSQKGLNLAEACAAGLAAEGMNIVSGYASGTDLAAHRGALVAGGVTTLVLVEGILGFRVKRDLAEWFDQENCLIISEFSPRTRWIARNAMQRNRTICGLSDAMILTESGLTGGTFAAGETTLELNLPLFVIHYAQPPESAEGNGYFLERGAHALRGDRNGNPKLESVLQVLGRDLAQSMVDQLLHAPEMPKTLELTLDDGSDSPAPVANEELPSTQTPQVTQSFAENLTEPMPASPYPKRLIEVDLPIKRISAHARREKSIRHGHISTLHIWWARRPLAACRAVICAALWIDPMDELCPQAFRERAAELITAFAKKAVSDKDLAKHCSTESWSRWQVLAKPENKLDPTKQNHLNLLRNALLDFIADFANWDNSTQPDYLETSRSLTQAAHEALGGIPGTKPLVVDPFAGGGSIPLEALRVGADAFASDLNPVAVLLNKVVLEYIPKYGQRLADEVRKWGQWVKEEAEKELAEFYPKDPDGATPIAYLWARTIVCEGPGCGTEVPLMRSMWLTKKPGRSKALYLGPQTQQKKIALSIIEKEGKSWFLPDGSPVNPENLKLDGTVRRGSATCPCCGFTTPVASVRHQLRKNNGGSGNARLFCVVTLKTGHKGRFYRLPQDYDQKNFERAARRLEQLQERHSEETSLIPDEKLDIRGIRHTWAMIYGFEKWGDLFSPRQNLALAVLAKCIDRADVQINSQDDNGFSLAVRTCLSLIFDKLLDLANSLCAWDPSVECPHHLFARQAIPITWDFVEGVVIGESSGSWSVLVDRFFHVMEKLGSDWNIASPQQSSASEHPLPDDSANAFVTDPPYYDAVPYSYLSDFFYVWLKRILANENQDLFKDESVPKDNEIIVDRPHELSNSHKDIDFYERELMRSFSEGRRVLRPDGIGVIVFASKTTASWEALLRSIVDSGWIISGSWPIDTEMGHRVSAQEQARLASSVHITCRPREDLDGTLQESIGDWRDVLQELPQRIHEWMPRLSAEGVVGADAIFACLGPALEIFSRYSRVEKASGEQVTLKEYLEYVWAAVSKEALGMIFENADTAGFEEDARLTAMWLWTLSTGSVSKDEIDVDEETVEVADDDEDSGKTAKTGGYVLEFDAARKIAQGLGAHLEKLETLVQVKGEKAYLLSVAERSGYLFGKEEVKTSKKGKKSNTRQLSLLSSAGTPEDGNEDWGDPTVTKAGTTVLDRIHQTMILFAAGRSEALKSFLVDQGVGSDQRFWTLAQALSALYPTGSDEKRWVDGVLARKKGLGF